MLVQSVIALFALLPFVASAPQQCHGHRCRSKTAVASTPAATSEIASSTEDTPAPVESSASASVSESEDGGDDTSSSTTVVSSDDTPSSTAAEPAGTSAALPTSGGGGGDYWKPSMSDTIVVDLENTPIPSNAASVYVVDLAHSADQIAAYKADGKHVACYFSAGAWDSYRDDKLLYKPECYCGPGETGRDEITGVCTADKTKQADWDAWWFDIKTPACLENIKEVHTARMADAAGKGCDAIDPDNVDGAFNDKNVYGITPADQLAFDLWLAETAHANGLAIDLKNAAGLIQYSAEYATALVAAFDYNVIESCFMYNECPTYQPFLDAGKPQVQLEYADRLAEVGKTFTTCDPMQEGVTKALYPDKFINSAKISMSCGV